MPKKTDDRKFWIVTLGSNSKKGLITHSCLLWSRSASEWYAKECVRIDKDNEKIQEKVSVWKSMGDQVGLVDPPVKDMSIEIPFAHLLNIEEVSPRTATLLTDARIYTLVEDHSNE